MFCNKCRYNGNAMVVNKSFPLSSLFPFKNNKYNILINNQLFSYKGIVCLSLNQFYRRVFQSKEITKKLQRNIKSKKKTHKQVCLILALLLCFVRPGLRLTDKWWRGAEAVWGHCEAPCHYCHQHFLLQIKRLCPQGFCRREARERKGRECGSESGRRECPTTKIGKCKIRTSIYHQGKENLL